MSAKAATDTATETVVFPKFEPNGKSEPYTARVLVRAMRNKGLLLRGTTNLDQYSRTLGTGRLIMNPEQGACPDVILVCPLVSWKDGSVVYFVDAPDDRLEQFDFTTVQAFYRYAIGGKYVTPGITHNTKVSRMENRTMPVSAHLINAPIPYWKR